MSRNRFRSAFTLVELLVVIGIIALLISILLPALNRARDQANSLKCLAQMRQLGTAFVQYLNDNKGTMPFIERDNSWKPWSAVNFGIGNPAGTPENQAAQRNNVHRHLLKYLAGRVRDGDQLVTLDSQVLRCPAAVDFPATSNAPRELSDTNYVANGVMILRKVTQVRRSAAIIAFSESRYAWNVSAMRPYPVGAITKPSDLNTVEYRQWMWYEGGSTAGNQPILNFSLHRKGQYGNVIYFDGHGESKSYKETMAGDFGLTDSATRGQGLETDTYANIIANPTAAYRAKLN